MYGVAPSLASAMDDDKPVYFKKVNALLERTGGEKKNRRGEEGDVFSSQQRSETQN